MGGRRERDKDVRINSLLFIITIISNIIKNNIPAIFNHRENEDLFSCFNSPRLFFA